MINKIFRINSEVNVDGSAGEILTRLKRVSTGGTWKSGTNRDAWDHNEKIPMVARQESFRFLMTGTAGIFRFPESGFVSGTIETKESRCIVSYSIDPGVFFWMICLIDLVFCSFCLGRDIIQNGSYFALESGIWIFGLLLLLVAVIENSCEERQCDRRLKALLCEKKSFYHL